MLKCGRRRRVGESFRAALPATRLSDTRITKKHGLSRGLASHLEGQANWLLTEFIQLAPAQFVDELVCEMTSLEVRLPGVRL